MAKVTSHEVVYVRAAVDIYTALKQLAVEENRSMSNMVETILREYLEQAGRLPKEIALAGIKD